MKTTLPFICLTTAVTVQGFAPLTQRTRHHAPSVGASSLSPATLRMSSNPLEELLSGIFKSGTKAAVEPEPELPDAVIEPDFKLAAIFLGLGVLLDTIPYIQLVLGPLVTVLGLLFLVQTFRIRFTFDKEAFELKQGDSLKDTGDNIVVGGANRWTYDSFVNVSIGGKQTSMVPTTRCVLSHGFSLSSMTFFQRDGLINRRDPF